jgi:hypothetical protein
VGKGSLEAREPWFGRTQSKANQMEDEKLVATEEAGTQSRWQIGPITPRTHQAVQPALGPVRLGKTRIGIHAQHRKPSTSLDHYSWKGSTAEPPFVTECSDSRLRLSVERDSTVPGAANRPPEQGRCDAHGPRQLPLRKHSSIYCRSAGANPLPLGSGIDAPPSVRFPLD